VLSGCTSSLPASREFPSLGSTIRGMRCVKQRLRWCPSRRDAAIRTRNSFLLFFFTCCCGVDIFGSMDRLLPHGKKNELKEHRDISNLVFTAALCESIPSLCYALSSSIHPTKVNWRAPASPMSVPRFYHRWLNRHFYCDLLLPESGISL
jgi:hypothetical protein